MGQRLSYVLPYDAGVMNMKSIRQIFGTTRRSIRPIYQQLEFKLPASKLTREDVELLAGLRRIRQELAKG